MLFKQNVLTGIAEGRITLAFRRWTRPTVKAGGSLRTPIGVLAIEAIEIVAERAITQNEARSAGYENRQELLADLNRRASGRIYRIALRYDGADPRIDLRQQSELSNEEFEQIKQRLERMDARSNHGPWTTATLKLLEDRPAERAAELAESIGTETRRFKTNVRKLKELGLTESLKIGYRLSPRGETVLRRLEL